VKILVVGSGGREHAIAHALLQSGAVEQVLCAPGNGGTALQAGCKNVALAVTDFAGISRVARDRQVDFVVVGPEVPLAGGIADALQADGVRVFGPTRAGAQLEASKSWAKELMAAAGVPTARSRTFTDLDAARAYLATQTAPIVIKADGLAAGKGVTVATELAEARAALADLFGAGPATVVIEDFLVGEEVSVLALTDGTTTRSLLPAQDHKRIGEGDTGPNTGGMGAYAPAPVLAPELRARVDAEILAPVTQTLRDRGIDYCGVLYAGLMVAPDGSLNVLEFNCRFGDPETQAVLPLLVTPLEELLLACVERRLDRLPPIEWKPQHALCVVMASAGYPGPYVQGREITGLKRAEALVFHAGTELAGDRLRTSGGRVLGVTGLGADLKQAAIAAYATVASIDFEGCTYRRDIGHRALPPESAEPQ